MKRVLIIGCPGSGKSTFARKLHSMTGLPLYYLDMIWHNADKTTVSRDFFDTELDKILVTDEWIIDGNYSRTLERRIERCDIIFLFDLPTEICIEGVNNRIGKPRPDMPWIEKEFDKDFYEWILNFRNDRLPEIMTLLNKRNPDIQLIIFNTRDESNNFLTHLDTLITPNRKQ